MSALAESEVRGDITSNPLPEARSRPVKGDKLMPFTKLFKGNCAD